MFKRLIYKESGQEHGQIKITDRKTNERTVRWFKDKYLAIILLGAYMLLTWAPLSYTKAYAQDNPAPKVLVLNSYHRAFKWTDGIIQGISSVLETEGQNIEIYIEDMDSKRFSSKAYIRGLQKNYALKFSGLKFDAIISSDDNAFHFLLRSRNDLFANTPVVFCGVNHFEDSMLKGHKLFTGVIEATDIKSNIELMLKLHPETKSVAVITDNTTTGEYTRKVLEQVSKDHSGIIEIISLDGSKITKAKLLKKLQDLPENSAVLLLNFHRDKSDRFIPYTKFIPILSAGIKSPLYCASDNFLGYGTVGGILNSAFHQGEAAGKMARLILQGGDVTYIPVLKESPNRYMFDYKQMQRFGIKLSNLPEGSIVINRPDSLDHKDIFWVGIASVSILSLIIIVLGFNINIRKKAEQELMKYQNRLEELVKERTSELRYSKTKLTNLIENVPIGIFTQGAKGSFTEINLTLCRIFGYGSKSDFLKMPASAHYYRSQKREPFSQLYEQGPVYNYETRFRRKDGSVFWGLVNSVPQTTETGTIQFINILQDISERKQAEEKIQASLKEKEALLQEVHHRVKNNMQVISSLLRIQASYIKDERVTNALLDCQGRIQAMAFVHETLYGSDKLSVIDCKTYITRLADKILHAYSDGTNIIKLNVNAENIKIGIEQATPLGLIVNELVSNSLKYAFSKNQHGEIFVTLRKVEQNIIEFIFSDSGTGIPEDLDWRNADSLGLQLIMLLAEDQLDGTVNLNRDNGTQFTIKFSLEENK